MINGSIYAVTDIGLAMQSLQGSKVLYIGELQPNLPQGFIECSVLLPPYEAVSAEIDGETMAYEAIYGNYLTFNEGCFGMLSTILIALNKGVNITMYIENGSELSHFQYLLNYIEGTFGITVGTINREFSYDPRFNWLISSILYSYMDGFIDDVEFISNQVDFAILITLDQTHPFIKPVEKLVVKYKLQNVPDIMLWLMNYRHMVLSYGAIVPGNMVIIGKDE